MKKLLTLTLALILTLALTACGTESEETSAVDTPAISEQEDTAPTASDTESNPGTGTRAEEETKDTEPTASKKNDDVVSEPAKSSEPATPSKPAASKPQLTVPPASSVPQSTAPDVSSKTESSAPDTNFYLNTTDTSYIADNVIVRPRHVYWDGDTLVAQCFVINGFPHNVWNIKVNSLRISNAQGVIAEGAFGYLNGVELPALTNCIWNFRFSADCIASQGADLSWLSIDFDITTSK